MGRFTASDGLSLYYEVRGEGPPVVLLHSFGFDGQLWVNNGVADALLAAERSVVLPDTRGHGRSDHPADPSRYGGRRLAADVTELLDQLAIELVDLAAYSMGSLVALDLLPTEPRIRRAVLGGVGGRMLVPRSGGLNELPRELSSEEAAQIVLRFAPHLAPRIERGASDPLALLEVARSGGLRPEAANFSAVAAEVLLICGADDDDPRPLAEVLPRAAIRLVEGNHGTAMHDPAFTSSLVAFLAADDD